MKTQEAIGEGLVQEPGQTSAALSMDPRRGVGMLSWPRDTEDHLSKSHPKPRSETVRFRPLPFGVVLFPQKGGPLG